MKCSGFDFKIARIHRKLRQIDVAKLLNITNSKLSLIENCYIECSPDISEKLIKIYKM